MSDHQMGFPAADNVEFEALEWMMPAGDSHSLGCP